MKVGADLISELAAPAPVPAPTRTTPWRWLRRGAALIALITVGVGAWWWWSGDTDLGWRTEQVTRGSLQQAVSSTGTLEAVTTVEVGTQISGVITELLVDFNDDVEAGQLIAQIDPTLLAAEVDSARASLSQVQATALLARQQLERTRFLAENQASNLQELQVAEAASTEASARVRSAQVAVERAERNLQYAAIVAPIDGTVVDRLVEVGQTVNAGLSAPTLYTLAGELEKMQILATVDEADIGLLSPGQVTTFTVQAWPDAEFKGTIRQVRLQSTTTDSVVTYTAVVDVNNVERLLLPGMTANVDFVVASANDVLTVPASALRFQPDTEDRTRGAARGGEPAGGGGGGGGGGGERAAGVERGQVLWTLDEAGDLQRIPVQVGLSDGSHTEVTGDGLTDGVVVVTGKQTAATSTSSSASPFQSSGDESRGAGRGKAGGS